MKLSILIPTWRRPQSLARGLAALGQQQRQPDELVLVVREDDAETRALLAELTLPFPLEVVAPGASGVVAALNSGFDRAAGDVVAITDDDTEPRPDWLARIEAHFAADPELGALGGRDLIVGSDSAGPGDPGLVVGKVLRFGRVTGNHHLAAGPPRRVDIVKGANMAVRRAALGEKRLDTALRGSGAEHHWEIDLSLAIEAKGWTLLYDPALEVLHHEAERFGGQREEQMSDEERFNAVHNQALALLKNLRGGRRLVATGYGLLFGTRADPGPALALELLLRGTPRGEVASRLRIATRARFAALREWRRSAAAG
ncbi:MAG TPA: glycosyltransferase family 2 protein [Solirubrobacterales bacterium]|nr:glycosyltransferase family 2 protein [Solirubrobacterales bacterium]